MKSRSSTQSFFLRNKITPVILGCLVFYVLVFGSCVADHEEHLLSDGNIHLKLRLEMTSLPTRSNDVSDNIGEKEGSDDEKTINWGDVWIAAFDAEDGHLIKVLYPEAGTEPVGNSILMEFDGSDSSGNIKIVALANWCRYGVVLTGTEGDATTSKVNSLNDLGNLTFSFPPMEEKEEISDGIDHINSYYPLPMQGEVTCSVDFMLNQEYEMSINMTRALAKIEVVDNMEGEIRIESASLVKYMKSGTVISPDNSIVGTNVLNNDVGGDLPFVRDGVNTNMFSVYVPEIIDLGDTDSETRKIKLKLSNGSESEIRLINYDSKQQPSTEISDVWKSLKRNYIYRFNVTGLVESEPEIEIQPTIRICWYDVADGKFRYGNQDKGYIYLFKRDDNFSMTHINSNIEISGNSINGVIKDLTVKGINYGYYNYHLNGEILGDLYYLIIAAGTNQNIEPNKLVLGHLKSDIIKYEDKKISGQDITFCWLNTPPIAYLINGFPKIFPNNVKYRIYWRGSKEYTIELIDRTKKNTELKIFSKQYDEYRNICYMDFEIVGPLISMELKIKDGDNLIFESNANNNHLSAYNFTIEEIDGKEYYVFYAN